MNDYPVPANSDQQAMFYYQFQAVRRDEVVGVLLALFLGGIGIHHFYLRRNGLGILYVLFCWTMIPCFIAFFECFFMPGRVRNFNATEAMRIAAMLGISPLLWGQPVVGAMNPTVAWSAPLALCMQCQRPLAAGSHFCSRCGAAL